MPQQPHIQPHIYGFLKARNELPDLSLVYYFRTSHMLQ